MDRKTTHRPDIDLDPVNFPEEVAAEVRAHLGGGGGGGAVPDHEDVLEDGHQHESTRQHNLHEKPGATPDFGMSQSRGGWQF